MRHEYELTEDQLTSLLDASKPVVCMRIGNHAPRSPQQVANAAWAAMGKQLGFDHMTVQPVPGKGQRFFTADSDQPKGETNGRT